MARDPEVSIEKFLFSKGGSGLLAVLKDGNKQFRELRNEMDVSETTLSQRLDEAAYLGFTEEVRGRKNGRRVKFHQLTDYGKPFADRLAHEGVVRNYAEMVKHKREIEKALPDVMEHI